MKKHTKIKEQMTEMTRVQLERDFKQRQDKLNARILQDKLNKANKKTINRVPFLNIPSNVNNCENFVGHIETKNDAVKDRIAFKKAELAAKSENLKIEHFKQSERMKEWRRRKEWEELTERNKREEIERRFLIIALF